MSPSLAQSDRWYDGITRYQWLVLLIASLGWIFDVFEGQIFVASMNEAMPSLAPQAADQTAAEYKLQIGRYNNIALAAFLAGGALGGIFFGTLSDRIGRKKTMSLTILFYSLFTCVSAFSAQWWHLAGLRFLVALGVGGEWAVASSMVAEVFPKKARAQVGGIFQASSLLGVYLAVAAGTFFIGAAAVHAWATSPSMNWVGEFMDPASLPWRLGFALGALPALLIIWIRMSLREPESWVAARKRAREQPQEQMGSIAELFRGGNLRCTLVGVALATVGLATFWGVHIYGKDMLKAAVAREYETADKREMTREGQGAESPTKAERLIKDEKTVISEERKLSLKRWEMLGMLLASTGGGIGLISFGPICQRIGRRPAFLLFHLGGLASSLVLFQALDGVTALLIALPIFGFLTIGMHSGYAIYFPELYPTRLRGTGVGFCFNSGRMLAAPVLIANSEIRASLGLSLAGAASMLSLIYLIGCVVLLFAPETKGRELLD